MGNEEPFEIIAAPFEAWLAPVGTAWPDLDAVPGSDWVKLGTSGDKSMSEDGVSIAGSQSLSYIRTLGGTLPRKAFRAEEGMVVTFTILDMKLEQLRNAFNGNAVTDTAAGDSTPGYRSLNLERGQSVTQKALLLRGPSPYMADGNMDFRLPRVVHEGEPEIVFKKDEPAGVLLQFQALDDDDKDMELVGQDAVAV